MIKNVLNDIGGIGLYGVISICLFFAVFTGAILRACFMKRSEADAFGALPLNDGTPATQKGDPGHE
jgi:hypothetical protein